MAQLLASPRLNPRSSEAFHRAVQDACNEVEGLPGASTTLAGARAAEPSLIRSVAIDPGDPARDYGLQLAREVDEAALTRLGEALAVRGPEAWALKSGMCRLVSVDSLLAGIEFAGLHGDPFDTYEFVLRFPVQAHHLCVWTTHRHGKVKLLLECGGTGRTIYSNFLVPGCSLSRVFGARQMSPADGRNHSAIVRLKGGRAYFVGLRLYLKAV